MAHVCASEDDFVGLVSPSSFPGAQGLNSGICPVIMLPYPRYRTAGYSFRVAHRVAICSARRSRIGFFI